MVITTLVQILAGLLIPVLLARAIHRRWEVTRALVVPGALAGLVAAILGALVQGGVVGAILGAPEALALPMFAGALGLGQGLLAVLLLTFVFARLAPAARSLPRVLMVGVGFGGAEIIMRAGLAAIVLVANVQLAVTAEEWDLPAAEAAARQANLDAYFATPVAEPLLEAAGAAGRVAHGLAVTALVGAMFLTGQIGWAFFAWFWAALAIIGAVLFGGGGPLNGALWWLLIGAISLGVIRQVARRAPAA